MQFYPTNPFFYWNRQTRKIVCIQKRQRRSFHTEAICNIQTIQENDQRAQNSTVRGFQNLKNMFDLLNLLNEKSVDLYGYPIPPLHMSLFIMLISTTLPIMFGKDYEYYKKQLLKDFNMDMQRLFTAACMPRRWGKTVTSADFVAMFCLSQTNDAGLITVIVVSMSCDISALLTESIVNTILKLTDGNITFTKNNEDQVRFVNPMGCKIIIHSRICTNVSFYL